MELVKNIWEFSLALGKVALLIYVILSAMYACEQGYIDTVAMNGEVYGEMI